MDCATIADQLVGLAGSVILVKFVLKVNGGLAIIKIKVRTQRKVGRKRKEMSCSSPFYCL